MTTLAKKLAEKSKIYFLKGENENHFSDFQLGKILILETSWTGHEDEKKSVANCNDCAGAGRQKCNSGIAQCSAKNPFQYLGSNSRHKVSDCQLFTGWGMCLKLSRLLWKKKILSLHFLPSYERKNNRVLMIFFCVTFPLIGRQGEYFARGTHTRKMDINVSMSEILDLLAPIWWCDARSHGIIRLPNQSYLLGKGNSFLDK